MSTPDETRNLYLAILNPIYEALHAERETLVTDVEEEAASGHPAVRPGRLAYATREHVQEIVQAAAAAAHGSVKTYLDAIGKADLCRAVGPEGKVCIRDANHSEQRHRFGYPEDEPKPQVVTFSPIHTENYYEPPGKRGKVVAGDMIRVDGFREAVAFKCFQWNADNGSEWLVVFAPRGGERHVHPDKFKSKARVVEARPAKVRKKSSARS